jgi:hypothetical protein
MADPRYEIDWSADLTPALAHFAAARNASKQNARADEYLKLQQDAQAKSAERHSAEVERQKTRDQHQLAIEAWNNRGQLFREAQRSPEAANVNPFGYKFDKTHDLPANVEGPEMSPDAEAARFAPKPAPAPEFHTPPQPPVGSLLAGEEGSELDPAAEAARHTMEGPQMAPSGYAGGGIDAFGEEERQRAANNLDAVGAGLHGLPPSPTRPEPDLAGGTPDVAPAPEHPMIAAARNASGLEPGPEGKRRLFASYQGQRFEVPEQSETTGFGPKYDAIYQRALQEPTITPEEAYKFVAKMAHDDTTEQGRNTRLTQSLGQRDTNREDQQTFARGENEKYRSEGLTFEQRKELANIMARAKMASAGAGPVSPGVATLVGMKEAGATDEEIYAEAAKLKLSQKEVTAPVQNVVKNAAAGERASEKRAALVATDERGQPIGRDWKNAQAAAKGTQQIQRFHRVETRLKDLIADVEQNGERIDPDSKQQINRMSKAEAAAAALRPYNELSSTDASMAAERAIIGPAGAFGHGWVMGADLTTLKRILHEAQEQQSVNLNTLLRPGGSQKLSPALGGPKHTAGGSDHASQDDIGATRPGPGGKTYRKVGPNNWQPVDQ